MRYSSEGRSLAEAAPCTHAYWKKPAVFLVSPFYEGYNDRFGFFDQVYLRKRGVERMRHGASLLASLEGLSLPAYRIASELASNSRSGLTVRFLSKKLELPEEEIEYLLDVNHRLLFLDLTKVKLVAEGQNAVKRIREGLENHGDIPSLIRAAKSMDAHEFRRLEELVGLEEQVTKKQAAEELIQEYYKHPDAILSYVATRGFSETAREVFDVIWQSKSGLLPISQIKVVHGGADFEVEQALLELFNGFALFEMFRFDSEDRLVRVAGLLKELRQYRETQTRSQKKKPRLKAQRGKVEGSQTKGLSFSDTLCRLVGAIAARPARLRGDGELFREDRRRLSEICTEEDDPSLNTCLWAAEGIGWLVRVDNELRAGELEKLIKMDRVDRHFTLYEWLTAKGEELSARQIVTGLLDQMKVGSWYNAVDFVDYATLVSAEDEQPVLKSQSASWHYTSPSATGQTQGRLARCLEETFFGLGMVDRASVDADSVFSLTDIGEAFLDNKISCPLREAYPPRDGEFVVQPNFDIVVPVQDVDPLLTVPLDQFCTRMSTGQASVYNLNKDTFTQAVQEGHDANAFVQFLLSHNKGGSLPANVLTTLEDWRGTMKRVKMRTVHIIESDDPIILADLVHRRKFKKFFVQVDPRMQVEYHNISRAELIKLMEKEGFVVD
jgi:hypothetical protein